MAAPRIFLARVDSRLVHGQVAALWCAAVGADLVLVANDEAAANPLRQRVMRMAVPSGVEARFLSLEDAAALLLGEGACDRGVALVAEAPADLLALVRAGVPITVVNVGNMGRGPGRRVVAPSVAVGEKDVEAFRALRDAGVNLEIRRVPSAPAEPVEDLLS